LLEKRLRVQLHKFFVKRGLGLKSYKFSAIILTILKSNGFNFPFDFIGSAVNKVLPFCVVKKVVRGKHRIVLLLPITYNKAFHVSINLLKLSAGHVLLRLIK